VGICTLFTARASALLETDAKKMVALSTLRQLGLIVVAMALSSKFVCLFHILRHAFAKANLFIIIGNLIYDHFSYQDSRCISYKNNLLVYLSFTISIVSLTGLVFSAGFFSKETILLNVHSENNRGLGVLVVLSIILITFLYCLKLQSSLGLRTGEIPLNGSSNRVILRSSSLLLVMFSVGFGYGFFFNVQTHGVSLMRFSNLVCLAFVTSFVLVLKGKILMGMGLRISVIRRLNIVNSWLKRLSERGGKTLECLYLRGQTRAFSFIRKSSRIILSIGALFILLL